MLLLQFDPDRIVPGEVEFIGRMQGGAIVCKAVNAPGEPRGIGAGLTQIAGWFEGTYAAPIRGTWAMPRTNRLHHSQIASKQPLPPGAAEVLDTIVAHRPYVLRQTRVSGA